MSLSWLTSYAGSGCQSMIVAGNHPLLRQLIAVEDPADP